MNLAKRIDQLERRAAAEAVCPAVPPLPLRQPADVVALLAEQAEAVRRDPRVPPAERAKVLALVAGLALRAMDAAGGAARVEALERALKVRADQQRAAERRQGQRQQRRRP
ncbi:MAG TPA: hypothetical protein VF796_14485 [Humisphaera sp.]